jgi:sporulation protein YlmC with PRC-barrel domain
MASMAFLNPCALLGEEKPTQTKKGGLMKRKRKQLLLAGATAASLALGTALHAQDAQGSLRLGDTELRGTAQADRTGIHADATTGEQKPVTEANKASNLVGMNVRNLANENLGRIHDMVVDLETGRIAYVILSVGGFLGIGDREIAVPLKAFQVSTNRDHLILNADRERIRNAPGLAREAWPPINSPLVSADQWPGAGTAVGTPGQTQTGVGTEAQSGTDTRPATEPDVGTQQPQPPQTDGGLTVPQR